MEIINIKIADYSESFTSAEPKIVRELMEASKKDLEFVDMQAGRQVGMLLKMLIRISDARRVLEAGTFTGYSALMMAAELPENGELITLEKNKRYVKISAPFFSRKPYGNIIKQVMGDALETMPKLRGPFDLIFLDADKIHYPEYYRIARKKSRPGGLIVLDNTLWGGEVITGRARSLKRFIGQMK